MNEAQAENYPRFLPQPNLNYISYPGMIRNGVIQNNQDGYRGAKIDLQKSRKYRVLFLGGSTTYGIGVEYPWQSYPEQVKRILNERFANDELFHSSYDSDEIINAGLEDATSSEELTHYLFKYRYYKPDACVINSGINDALIVPQDQNYQPDYTHRRNVDFNIRPVGFATKCLLKSRFFSFVYINFFYGHLLKAEPITWKLAGDMKYSHWFKQTDKEHPANAFYYNLQSLMRELNADKVKVLFVTSAFKADSQYLYSPFYFSNIQANNKIGIDLSDTSHFEHVDFNYGSFVAKADFLDECHLNEHGETEKAKLIAPSLEKIIRSSTNDKDHK